MAPCLTDTVLVTTDGLALPLHHWLPENVVRAVIVAFHGINDHGGAFEQPACRWRNDGIAVYAHDQRGFGNAPDPGRWQGAAAMIGDGATLVRLAQARHPDAPVFMLGESMGAAVAVAALGQIQTGEATTHGPAGLVLLSPAVWSLDAMPIALRWLVGMGARLVPGLSFGRNVLRSTATDNRDVLVAMAGDERYPRRVRLDMLAGVGVLMDRATGSIPHLRGPVLLLHGAQDSFVTPRRAGMLVSRLRGNDRVGLSVRGYPEGHHLLLRDRQAGVVIQDVRDWVLDRAGAGPSAVPPKHA